ncbi:MAG TPA: hypothetical protein VHC47_11400, partial [Mucilaginibacter sp.]|nr:hypothetical protein [Mucilaginibacter sp.]
MKMNRAKAVFISFLLIICACNVPQYISVPVTYAPLRSFRPDTTTILLVNRFDCSTLKINNAKKLGVIKAGAFSSLRYAETSLGQLPHVRVINRVDSVSLNVSRDSIQSLASQYHADYVLVLEDFSADIALDNVENSTAYYNTN